MIRVWHLTAECVLQPPGASCTPAHFSHSRRFAQSRQTGVRKGQSTCDQVAALTTFIANEFQQNLKTGAVFLDLTAAYDTVWHTGLLYILSKSMPYWFTRLVGLLLRDRRFRVHMTWTMTPVLGDPNVTAFLKVLSLHQFCQLVLHRPASYTWPKIHLH